MVSEEPDSNFRRTPTRVLILCFKTTKACYKAGFLNNMVGEEIFFEHQANPSWFESLPRNAKKALHFCRAFFYIWSVKRDSNPRPSGPKPDALPSCAIHRNFGFEIHVNRGSPSGPPFQKLDMRYQIALFVEMFLRADCPSTRAYITDSKFERKPFP